MFVECSKVKGSELGNLWKDPAIIELRRDLPMTSTFFVGNRLSIFLLHIPILARPKWSKQDCPSFGNYSRMPCQFNNTLPSRLGGTQKLISWRTNSKRHPVLLLSTSNISPSLNPGGKQKRHAPRATRHARSTPLSFSSKAKQASVLFDVMSYRARIGG